MIQTTALYGSADQNKQEALGTGVQMFMEDVEEYDVNVHQIVVTGGPGGYSVEVTFFIGEEDRPQLINSEHYEILG